MVDFAVPVDHRVKIKGSEKRDNYQDHAGEVKIFMEHKGDGDTNCNRRTRNNPQRIVKGTRNLLNQWTTTDHPDYSIIMIG